MSRKRNDKGQFETQYDWPVLIPKICGEFCDGVSLSEICSRPGFPSRWQFWHVVNRNPEYKKEWGFAIGCRKMLMDSDYDEFADLMQAAFDSGQEFSAAAARIMLQTINLKYDHLERLYCLYGGVERCPEMPRADATRLDLAAMTAAGTS